MKSVPANAMRFSRRRLMIAPIAAVFNPIDAVLKPLDLRHEEP